MGGYFKRQLRLSSSRAHYTHLDAMTLNAYWSNSVELQSVFFDIICVAH